VTRRIPAQRRVFQGAVRAAIRISTLARKAGPAMVLCLLLFTAGAAWLTWSASAHVWERKSWNRLFGGSAQPPSGGASAMIARPEDNTGGGTYTIIDIPGAGMSAGTGTIAGGIDAAGDVAGVYLDSNGAAHSYLQKAGGTVTPINAPLAGTGATQGTFALNIDPTGNYVTGMYADSSNVYHGFLFQTANDTLTTIDVSGAGTTGHRGTIAVGVNSAGTVVGTYVTGSYTDGTSYYYGFAQTLDGTVTAINAPDAGTGNQDGTVAMGINASGAITGLFFAAKQVPFGFVRVAGTLTEFGVDCQGSSITTDCYATIPVSIDAAGDVTGTSRSGLTASSVSHGFVRAAGGAITTFDPVGSVAGSGEFTGTLPLGIDPGGNYITGTYTDSNGLEHGFVRSTSDGTITSFDAPLAATTLTFLLAGTGGFSVNASGQIAGTYVDSNSVFHGFLLTPAAAAQAATPTFSPAAGTYTSAQAVTISDTTSGATIHYTTNGTTPTASSTAYSGPITVSSSETLEALATADGYTQSAVATAAYTVNLPAAATPTFSPAAGTYTSTQTVTISDATSGAIVYYTTNGTTPTASSSTYSVPLSVSSTETIEAIATASGYSPSAAASATYTIGAPFSIAPASGSSTTATVKPGGTAVYSLTIAPAGGTTFPAAITFSASGLPSGATATFNPSTIAAGAGTTTVSLSIQTSSSSAMLRRNKAPYTIALCLLLIPLAGLRRRKTTIRRASDTARSLFLLLLLCGAAAGLGACGGSGGNGSGSPQTYTVTVTATSGQAQQTTTLQLTVQ
jgi:hypothetical protein